MSLLQNLLELVPAEQIKIQPAAAREELRQLEKTYNLNTLSFLTGERSALVIPEEVAEKWINLLDVYINFNGSMDDLNQFKC